MTKNKKKNFFVDKLNKSIGKLKQLWKNLKDFPQIKSHPRQFAWRKTEAYLLTPELMQKFLKISIPTWQTIWYKNS